MAARPAPASIVASPDWLAHRYDAAADAIQFVQADRALRRSITFLTDEYLPKSDPVSIGRRDALSAAPLPAPIHFIFHSAFCCSTLLAAGMDRDGLATSAKEPQILNDLVGWRRRGASGAQVAEVLDGALALLARPFQAGEAVIVKPSNIVNGLAPVMLTMRPEARAVLLYAPLRVFLTSVAKKGIDGRLWVRELFMGLRTEGLVQRLGFDDAAFFRQTDLQIAAAGWLAQQALFAGLIAAPSTARRVRSLDSEALLAKPDMVLAALGAHYGLPLTPRDIDEIVAGPFKRNAKSGGAFGKSERETEHRAAADAHADEIDKVTRWAEVVAEGAGIPLELNAPLV